MKNTEILQRFEFQIAALQKQQEQWMITHRPGTAWRFIEPLGSGVELEMVKIPAGEFLMGAPEDEPERWIGELPQHRVTIPTFFMGRYPVTCAQWNMVTKMSPVERELSPDRSYFWMGDHYPIERVSWEDAVEFCARLSFQTQRKYRLPSEAEWEYACRAGTTTPFSCGETLTDQLANYTATIAYNDGSIGEYREETTPVNYFNWANAFGLCDMHGNVSEWCQDVWHDNYQGAPTDGSAWMDGGDFQRRVQRGGSWDCDPWCCRSACREAYDFDSGSFDIGFRVAASIV